MILRLTEICLPLYLRRARDYFFAIDNKPLETYCDLLYNAVKSAVVVHGCHLQTVLLVALHEYGVPRQTSEWDATFQPVFRDLFSETHLLRKLMDVVYHKHLQP